MTDTEFRAMVEADRLARDIWSWQPTDEELHRMFWCEPLPLPPAVQPPPVVEVSEREYRQMAMAQNMAATSAFRRAADMQNTASSDYAMALTGRAYYIEFYAGGSWQRVAEGGFGTPEAAAEQLRRHRTVQGHLLWRIV